MNLIGLAVAVFSVTALLLPGRIGTLAETPGGPTMHEKIFPLVAFTLGSLAGLADLLRSKKRITRRLAAAAMLWNGLMSLAAALALWSKLRDDPWMLYGVAIAVGVGVFSVVDVIAAGVRAKLQPPGGGNG